MTRHTWDVVHLKDLASHGTSQYLTDEELQSHLPVYRFQNEARYSAPGIIQIINDITEVDGKYITWLNIIKVTVSESLYI